MSHSKKAVSALISVFHKDGLEPIVRKLNELGIALYSTGGTEKFIRDLGLPVTAVEDITGYTGPEGTGWGPGATGPIRDPVPGYCHCGFIPLRTNGGRGRL